MLKDKPTILHLMGYVAIDNTKSDPKLAELKKMIFKLATQHPHWGEEKPARWLPLEQAIITLKASGAKVVPLSLVEEINRSGSVRIETEGELDLFLRYQHEMGTVLYFSVVGLREKIVLDPQWLIDALKSLITAEMFIITYPAIISKWVEFKEKGKLTQELIDAIWTKKECPELHDNKEHVLLLMEKLNIIASPKAYTKDGKEIKGSPGYKGGDTDLQLLIGEENNILGLRTSARKRYSNSVIAGKPHRNFLNRYLPALVRDLDFQAVSVYIQEKELFDDVTMCDISYREFWKIPDHQWHQGP